jgi:hypothetical protein
MGSTVPWQVVSASTTNSAPPWELEPQAPIALLEDGKVKAGKKLRLDNNRKPKSGR